MFYKSKGFDPLLFIQKSTKWPSSERLIISAMDAAAIISFLQESLFVIVVFVCFLFYALARGRQALINVIMSLYLALLISLKFPYYDFILGRGGSERNEAILMIAVFAVFAIFSVLLFGRLMPSEFDEGTFESFGKKIAFALAGTVLIMAYSYHALPITELIDPGSPIQQLFAPNDWFFWWLILPLVVLFFL